MRAPESALLRLLALAIVASAGAIQPLAFDLSGRRAITPHSWHVAKARETSTPAALKDAYLATGLATTGAWATVVWTSIRSNQPLGALMPSPQHGIFARLGALSAVPLIYSCFSTLASADSWETLASDTYRRLNLAVTAAGVGSALWVRFADVITQIPGTAQSHQAYRGVMRAALMASYGSAAVLGAAVWVRSLPEDVRKKPLSWPGRVADGVCKSLVGLGPANAGDPTNVKYALLSSSFLLFTALQLHTFPTAVIPSWTGRRCSRAFPAWTLLAAVSAYNLKEARENGKVMTDQAYRTLSNGLTGFGATYLAARAGAVFLDPSFPGHYGLVKQVPAWAAASAAIIALTLRPDDVGPAKKVTQTSAK